MVLGQDQAPDTEETRHQRARPAVRQKSHDDSIDTYAWCNRIVNGTSEIGDHIWTHNRRFHRNRRRMQPY